MPVGEAARGCELRSVCQLRNAGAKRRGGNHPQPSGASAKRRDAKRPPAQRTRWQSNASTQRSTARRPTAPVAGESPPPRGISGATLRRHAGGALRERNIHERGKEDQGRIWLGHAWRHSHRLHRHRRRVRPEHHRARERRRGRRGGKPSLGLGPGAQHHRLLPDLDSRIRLLHPAARAGARVHPLRRLQGHRA